MKSLTSRELIASSNSSSVPKKHVFRRRKLFPDRANLWKIESGVVRTYTWLDNGTNVTLGLWTAGDVIGRALSKIEPLEIECLTTVEATILPMEELVFLSDVLLNHIYQNEELMLIRSYKTVDIMVLKLLGWLTKKFGRTVKTGQLIDLRLTHQDIAELLNTTRVTVTRILIQLEEQGMIQRLPLHLTVVQAQELWHYEI